MEGHGRSPRKVDLPRSPWNKEDMNMVSLINLFKDGRRWPRQRSISEGKVFCSKKVTTVFVLPSLYQWHCLNKSRNTHPDFMSDHAAVRPGSILPKPHSSGWLLSTSRTMRNSNASRNIWKLISYFHSQLLCSISQRYHARLHQKK